MSIQNVRVVNNTAPRMARKMRTPQHSFQLRIQPFHLFPCLLAPVLPGETMKRAVYSIRAVSETVRNPLAGAHFEFYLFYVKLTDMPNASLFRQMILEPGTDLSSVKETGSGYGAKYQFNGGIKWSEECLEAVTNAYFRHEGQTYADHKFTGSFLPKVRLGNNNWLHSAALKTEQSDDDPTLTVGVDDLVTGSEVDQLMREYSTLRLGGLTDMNWEDFLASYGVSVPKEDQQMPELLRQESEWTYPTNTIDASDGSPSSAWSWSIRGSADKDRYFKEPGFIFGCVCVRPKVYLKNQSGAAAGMLDDVYAWLPAHLHDDPSVGLKEYAAGTGPLPNQTAAYIVDRQDLFHYGDQFSMYPSTETERSFVDLPETDMNKEYPSDTAAVSMFTTGNNYVHIDANCMFRIAGTISDKTAALPSTA